MPSWTPVSLYKLHGSFRLYRVSCPAVLLEAMGPSWPLNEKEADRRADFGGRGQHTRVPRLLGFTRADISTRLVPSEATRGRAASRAPKHKRECLPGADCPVVGGSPPKLVTVHREPQEPRRQPGGGRGGRTFWKRQGALRQLPCSKRPRPLVGRPPEPGEAASPRPWGPERPNGRQATAGSPGRTTVPICGRDMGVRQKASHAVAPPTSAPISLGGTR